MTFREKVFEATCAIPKGKTVSYKEIALMVGSPRAARAVANVLAGNIDPTIPCHRVIKSDGRLGGYNGINGESKKALLEKEGAI